MGGDFLQIKSI